MIEIKENKKQFLSLLLLADEQEDMIEKYRSGGTMYVLEDNGVKEECVVIDGVIKFLKSKTLPFRRIIKTKDTEEP